jgi:hypothetical protein
VDRDLAAGDPWHSPSNAHAYRLLLVKEQLPLSGQAPTGVGKEGGVWHAKQITSTLREASIH